MFLLHLLIHNYITGLTEDSHGDTLSVIIMLSGEAQKNQIDV